MSDPKLAQLLDRAVQDAPQMHLSADDLLAAGRGRVRRRRAVGVGGVLGSAAIVAAVWGGLAGGAGDLLGTTEIQPATTVWEQGERVDGTLFAGFQTIDDGQVAHSYDAQLSRPVTDGPVTLVLRDGGAVAEEIPAQSPVPGLEVFAGERMTVAVWTEPEGVVTSVPVVGPHDPGGPSGVERATVQGEELAYAVWAGDVVAVPEQVVDVYLVGEDDAVALSGETLESVVLRAGGQRAVSFVDPARGVWGSFLTAPREHAGSGATAPLAGPAQTGSAAFGWDGSTTSTVVLPQGAQDVRVQLDGRGGRADTAELAGRPVALWVAEEDRAAVSEEAVTFTLGGTAYDLAGYSKDLREIELADGSSLEVVPDAETSGSVVLRDGSATAAASFDPAAVDAGLVSEQVGGSLVTVVVGWDSASTVLADSRVELSDGGTPRWVTPSDVAQVTQDDGTLVTVLSVPEAEAVADGSAVSALGRQVGDEVERWDPPVSTAGGVQWRDLDGELVPTVDGQPLERVDDGSLGELAHYAGPTGSTVGYLVAPVVASDWTLLPVTLTADGLRVDPYAVVDTYVIEAPDRQVTVLTVLAGLSAGGTSAVAGLAGASDVDAGSANTWRLLGATDSAHLLMDPGAVVTVAADQGLWLLYPLGSTDPAGLEVGRIGESVLRLPAGPGADGQGSTLAETLVAVHPEDQPAPRIGDAGGELSPTATHEIADLNLVVRTWSVDEPTG